MTLPSPTPPEGSGSIAASMRATTSGQGQARGAAKHIVDPRSETRSLSSGRASSPAFRASSSRGETDPATTRPMMRSRSGTPSEGRGHCSPCQPVAVEAVYGVQALLQGCKVQQRLPQPASQQPRTHHRAGPVDGRQHRQLTQFSTPTLEQLQVAPGAGVPAPCTAGWNIPRGCLAGPWSTYGCAPGSRLWRPPRRRQGGDLRIRTIPVYGCQTTTEARFQPASVRRRNLPGEVAVHDESATSARSNPASGTRTSAGLTASPTPGGAATAAAAWRRIHRW